jgi:phage portal protein BeeE
MDLARTADDAAHGDRRPAVLTAIRLVSESIGKLPMSVYSGIGADKKPAMDSWQWRLLRERPNDEQSPFDFWYDVAVCVETHGNAYCLKEKGGRDRRQPVPAGPVAVQVERNKRTSTKSS